MKQIRINSSDRYPEITLDKANGIFEIKGISLPENGKEFYQPVLDFLGEYAASPNAVTLFVFNLRYFNISSSKMILFILYKLREIHESGKTVLVTWCFEDNDLLEAGQDFEHMSKVPFQFKEMHEETFSE